ncbi:KGG domain-containing protein [Mycolicibacterium neoaurum]
MPRGFAAMPPEKVSAAGRKGGLISKRRKRTEAS